MWKFCNRKSLTLVLLASLFTTHKETAATSMESLCAVPANQMRAIADFSLPGTYGIAQWDGENFALKTGGFVRFDHRSAEPGFHFHQENETLLARLPLSEVGQSLLLTRSDRGFRVYRWDQSTVSLHHLREIQLATRLRNTPVFSPAVDLVRQNEELIVLGLFDLFRISISALQSGDETAITEVIPLLQRIDRRALAFLKSTPNQATADRLYIISQSNQSNLRSGVTFLDLPSMRLGRDFQNLPYPERLSAFSYIEKVQHSWQRIGAEPNLVANLVISKQRGPHFRISEAGFSEISQPLRAVRELTPQHELWFSLGGEVLLQTANGTCPLALPERTIDAALTNTAVNSTQMWTLTAKGTLALLDIPTLGSRKGSL